MKLNLSPSSELLRRCHELQMGLQDFRRLRRVDYNLYGATHGQAFHTQPLPPLLMVLTCFQVSLKHNCHVSGAHACMWVIIDQLCLCLCVCVCVCSSVHAISAHSICGTGT